MGQLLNTITPTIPTTSNTLIRHLIVYEYQGGLVFDDPEKGLYKEAFISGIDDMIFEVMDTKGITDKCKLTFSAQPFPGSELELQWFEYEHGGNWYHCPQLEIEGWLCPALYHYFPYEPARLFVKIDPVK